MTINETGTHHRTAADQQVDKQQVDDNFLNESWKDWPNDAGFSGLTEHRGPLELKITGSIPAWAAGTLYRNGPGMGEVEDTIRGTHHVSHWFDGFAQAHKFDIIPPTTKEGTATVTYSSRRQSDKFVDDIKSRGWRTGISFAQKSDPCVGIFAKATSYFRPYHTNNGVAIFTNIPGVPSKAPANAGHRTKSSRVFVLTDQASFQDVNPDTLEPLGVVQQGDIHMDLDGPLSCAHAMKDDVTGDMFNVNLKLGRQPVYRVFRMSESTGSTEILASIKGLDAAYFHSFFLTDNFVVLCIPTSHYEWYGAKVLWERNVLEAMKPFDKADRCKWVVVDRHHGKGEVARFSTPAAFFFHSANAFEVKVKNEQNVEQVDLCLDYIEFSNTDIMFSAYYDVILNRDNAAKKFLLGGNQRYKNINPRFVRQRFRMPTKQQTAKEAASATAEETLSIPTPHAGELPTINPAYARKPYRYVFCTSWRGLSTISEALVKTDLETKEALMWCGPGGHTPGEPIFIQRPGSVDEDDGVILSVVLDGSARKSYLLCLDAKTMTERGRAEADFPIAIGLHGIHAAAVQ